MAPWVTKFFMNILPKILCIERPKKDNPPHDDDIGPPEVLTDVFHCPPDVDKFTHDYNTTDYGLPGKCRHKHLPKATYSTTAVFFRRHKGRKDFSFCSSLDIIRVEFQAQ